MEETLSPSSGEQAATPRLAALLKTLLPSLVLAGVVGTFSSLQGAGVMVFVIFMLQGILIPARVYTAVTLPAERHPSIGRIVIWLATIAAICTVHNVRDDANRKNADEIVVQIATYSAVHGKCAASIEELGMSRAELKDKLGYGDYFCNEGKQHFLYHGSFDPFSSWSYDFSSRQWQYRPD